MKIFSTSLELPKKVEEDSIFITIIPDRNSSEEQKIFNKITIQCSRSEPITVGEIKAYVLRLLNPNLNSTDTKITFAGKVLADDRYLEDYNYSGEGEVLRFLFLRV